MSLIYNSIPIALAAVGTTLTGLQVNEFARIIPLETALFASAGLITSLFFQTVLGAFKSVSDLNNSLSMLTTNVFNLAGIGFSLEARFEYIGAILKTAAEVSPKYTCFNSNYYTKMAQNIHLISFNFGFMTGNLVSRSFTLYQRIL